MGLFDKISGKKQDSQPLVQNEDCHKAESTIENTYGVSLLNKHKDGLLDDKSFLSSFGKVKVFYSTPFGDHKDGGSRLFALPAEDNTAYLPVFTSADRATEFYEKAGRLGFIIMESSFISFLESIKKVNKGNTPIKLGVVIEPEYYGVTISANFIDTVIDMII